MTAPNWERRLPVWLAVSQLLDAAANAALPSDYIERHLDHLGVPGAIRHVLPVIKVTSSLGLVAGLRHRRIGALTAAGLVAYYSAAACFHVLAGDRLVVALPAAAFGASAAASLLSYWR